MSEASEPRPLVLRTGDFETAAEVGADSLIRISGNADGAIVGPFEQLILDLHARLVGANGRAIGVDISQLEFMNAACFNVFVTWLGVINDLPPEQRYQLCFRSNPAIPWQRRSLRTLACFATDLVTFES